MLTQRNRGSPLSPTQNSALCYLCKYVCACVHGILVCISAVQTDRQSAMQCYHPTREKQIIFTIAHHATGNRFVRLLTWSAIEMDLDISRDTKSFLNVEESMSNLRSGSMSLQHIRCKQFCPLSSSTRGSVPSFSIKCRYRGIMACLAV